MKPILKVTNLSKTYLLRADKQLRTLRDAIAGVVARRPVENSYEKFWALKNISFEVQHGECLGIIGRNGAGKSTLLKVISRIILPTSGNIVLRGRVASLLELGTGFHPELTGRENIFLNATILGESDHNIRRKMDAIIDFAGVEEFIGAPIKHYSSGMQARLGFAIASHIEGEILIIDEIISTGDFEFREKCTLKINESVKSGRTILFVSHNNHSIEHICSRVLHISQGQLLQDSSDVPKALATYMETPSAPISKV